MIWERVGTGTIAGNSIFVGDDDLDELIVSTDAFDIDRTLVVFIFEIDACITVQENKHNASLKILFIQVTPEK